MSDFIKVLLAVILIVVLVIAGPFLVIWSWNTLFGTLLSIPYTFWTWLAVLIIGTFIRSDIKLSKRD
jgi:hypothetical protein